MNEQSKTPNFSDNEKVHALLSELHKAEACSQRDLSARLEVSLGKVNYLLKELLKRGFISIKSFGGNPDKIKKIRYMLTKKGFSARVELTQYFLKKKEKEFLALKNEWESLKEQA